MNKLLAYVAVLVAAITLSACAECKLPPPQTGPLPACVLKDKTIDCAKTSGLWTGQEALDAAGLIFEIIVSAGATWQADLAGWATSSQLPRALDFILCDAPAIEAYFAAVLKGEKGTAKAMKLAPGYDTAQTATRVHERVEWIKATWGPKAHVVGYGGMQVIIR